MKDDYLTTNQGAPVTDDQNSLTIGERGPILLQAIVLLEKLAHFDRERIPVGKMVLNRNPENYFAEVGQSAFNPATIVPGIDFSNDKVLQGRLFPYADTQRYRLGTNYLEIPINRPMVAVNNNMQDGPLQIMPNHIHEGKHGIWRKDCKSSKINRF